MNRYFLLIACLQLIKTITPVNPLTTWLPLLVIFAITSVKELVDDLGRRRSDAAANSRPYDVVRNGTVVRVRGMRGARDGMPCVCPRGGVCCEQCLCAAQIPSEEIAVGDIIRLNENDEIPCDAVVVSTSDPQGTCFIQVCRWWARLSCHSVV
jgi:phospholipid-translocating ATPase